MSDKTADDPRDIPIPCCEDDVIIIEDPELSDCEKLAKLAATGPNDANIKPVVDALKAKTSNDKEW